MFRDRDLPLRLVAALLPPRLGYGLTRLVTPLLAGARGRHVAAAVAASARGLLGDPATAERAARDFVASIACDDLDAVTAWLWPEPLRTATVTVEGADALPTRGPAVFVSFHLGGGFRVFDVLERRGLRPALLAAPPPTTGNLYDRALGAVRFAYLRRRLGERLFLVGRSVPRAELRTPAPHLADGGSVVALLDVAPGELGVRDAARVPLLGRTASLPNGILRLAASAGAAVVPFEGRLEGGRRVLRFHPPLRSPDAGVLTAQVAAVFERVIRERPWDWQGWLDAERLLAPPGGEAAPAPPRASAAGEARGLAIVVPVYEARADVEACLTSVLRHMPPAARLVVVDDASGDPALVAWLDRLAAADPRVELLRNEANQGFVRAANRGMRAAAGADVILLNSDTVVAAGFAEALAAAVRHTARTGIVSPLTNNGTVCSVPRFMEDNELPPDLGPDDMARLVAATSLRRRPELVTAVGFCMYVRAEVLASVGLFDEASFGRGYGEENDLCERAKAAGFEIRACDDAFVYHRGRASFGGAGSERERANLEVLGRLHPGYHAAVQDFIRANPLAEIQANVAYQCSRRAARRHPALLFALHANPLADPQRENVGGTQLHVRDLVRALAVPRAVIAFPEGDALCALEVEAGDVGAARAHRFPAGAPLPRFALDDPAGEARVAALVERFDVAAAHLHHLLFWPVGTGRVLRERGIPYAFTIHDYYAVCPSWNLFDFAREERCACHAAGATRQRECLTALFGACGLELPGDAQELLERHRAAFGELLRGAAAVLAPSGAARAVVAAAHPELAAAIRVLPHGYGAGRPAAEIGARPDPPAGLAAAPAVADPGAADLARAGGGPAAGARGRALRVALLGAPAAPWKGSRATLEAIGACRDLPVEWHLLGVADAYGFADAARSAVAGGAASLHEHGRYERDAIAGLLAAQRIDVTLHLSPWDETYAYTLTESWLAGVPAIVSDRGALAERARETGAAWVARDAAEAARHVRALLDDPAALERLRAAARAVAIPSIAENAAAHRSALAPLLARLTPRAEAPPWGDADRELFLASRRAAGEAR